MASRKGFFGSRAPQHQQSFILEPILTPSGFIDGGDDTPDPVNVELVTPLDDELEISADEGDVTDGGEDLAIHPQEIPDVLADDDLEEIAFVTHLDSDPDITDGSQDLVGEDLDTLDTPSPEDPQNLENVAETDPKLLETQDFNPVSEITEESNISENPESETSLNLTDTVTEKTTADVASQVDQADNSVSELDPDQVAANSLEESNDFEELSPDINTETKDVNILEETEQSEESSILNEAELQSQAEVNDQQIEPESELETDNSTVSQVEEETTTEITSTEQIDAESEVDAVDAIATSTPNFKFDSGVFTVDETGKVGIDYLFDGGKYKGQLAIFSLEGMEQLEPGSSEFIQEAASRALSNSELGHIVIYDATEGAKFSGQLSNEVNWNQGEYQGVKTFNMQAGDQFAIMLVPNGKVAQVFQNPDVQGALRPLFSLATANPEDGFSVGQIADVTGDGNTFVMEDLRVDGNTDKDYNDLIFQVRGATGKAVHLDEVINPAKDWRSSDLGEGLIAYAKPYITPEDPLPEIEDDLASLLDELDGLLADDFDFELESEPEAIVAETNPESESEPEAIATETNPELETELEVIVDETNPELETELEVIVDETTPELESQPEAIVDETIPESETEPKVVVTETNPESETEPEAIATETNPELETELEVTVAETTPELESQPEAIVAETTPELAPETEVIVTENNPESETESEVIVAETTPELESESEVIVAETTPELETESEAIVVETTPELETEPEVIVAETTPELESESEAIVAETNPESETESEVIVAETIPESESKPEVVVAETTPELESKPEVVVAETTPELESESESIVAETTPELETESEVIVAETTPELEPETEVIVSEDNQDLIEETEPIVIGGEENDTLTEVETPEYPTEIINDPEEISIDNNPIVPLNITEDNSEIIESEITPIVSQEPSNELVDRLENLTQQLRNQTLSEQPVNETLITRLEQLTTQLQNKPSNSLSSTALQLIEKLEAKLGTQPPIPTPVEPPFQFEFATEKQPIVGVIDTGFSGNNPDIDYTQITWGSDKVDSDADPTLTPGEGNEHGTHVLGIIAAQQNNGIGIDGINDNAPIWAGRAIGSGKWAESLVEFVDAAKASGQPNAVVNLSLDLTQINPDGSVTTRYELTPQEEAAIAYAQKHNIIVVVSAGDNPGTMSALGELSKEFDNLITVGAAQRVNDAVAVPTAYAPASYSGSGDALDIVADGNSGSISSTTVATAKVTGTISQVWAANPDLNYTQVIDIIKRTATDLAQPNWDSKTGAGLLNIAAAITLAKATEPELYTVKPGQRTITDNFISQNPTNKPLPGDPTHPAATPPGVPQTAVDTGGNSVAEAVQLLPSGTQDIIDQVSPIDPTDTYRLDSRYLQGTEFSVLSGELSVSYLTPSGEVLATQVFGKGSHQLQLPANATDEIILKIDRRNDSPATYMLYGFETTATEPFNIGLEFDSPLTTSQQQIMEAVAKSVASLIGKGLPSAVVDGKIIDDINIKISTANLDGLGGTQARTKIDFMRYGTLLPAQSLVQFDANDIAELERSGQLFSVVQHEFLHALGFGNLWEAKGLVDYAGTPLAQYNGASAVEAFQELGGLTDAITLESEGDGSASLHWHEMLFQDEIMTADLNGEATGNAPISTVTLASLADLGYEVNLAGATADYSLFGGDSFNPDDLTPEQIAAFRELAETSFAQPGVEYIAPIMPEVDPDKVAPEIWAHAERFWKNGEYYDWVDYQIKPGDTLSGLALRYLGNAGYDYYKWIGDYNGVRNYDYIVAWEWIKVPQWHPNYEREQEQERLRREAELKQRQEEEARKQREQEEAFAREQERVHQEEEARRQEAERLQRELEEQERRLREEMERHRQEEERRLEEARLAELARQAAIAEQQGKGGLDWFVAKPLPEFGPVDPFETRLTGETVGNLVPDDYYRFTLSRNGRITAELRQLLADADLVLYDVRNRPIAYSMREGITDEHIIADLIPGTYMLRVNSPKGVTTDYELIVKFKHLLSRTEQGPPDGWQVGGGNNGGGVTGPLFSDPRIQRIYDTALANFAGPERAKANAKIDELQREKRSYEKEMQALLDQMNDEQRKKIHKALDDARHNANVWVDNIANPIKNTVDSLGNGIKNKADDFANGLLSKIDGIWDFGNGWIKDRKEDARKLVRQGRDAVKNAVNNAQSCLKGELGKIQDGVKSAIWHFFEAIKNAYRTGAEINQAIANAANKFRSAVDSAVRGANELVGKFKGQVLSAVDWTKNLGIKVDKFGVKFEFNAYNQVVKPAVDAIASGVSSTINGIGNGLKDITNWLEPRTQDTVAKIVNALFGDQTGHLWNKIHGVDAKIAATRTGLEKAISAAKQHIGNIARKIDDFLPFKEERKRVLDALFNRGFKTVEEAYEFIKYELPKVRDQIAKEIKEAFEAAKKAFANFIREKVAYMLPGNQEKSIKWSGNLGVGLNVSVAKGTIKEANEYELSRELDNGKASYFTTVKPSVSFEFSPPGTTVDSPIEVLVSGEVTSGSVTVGGKVIDLRANAGLSIAPTLDVEVKHKFNPDDDDDMVRLGIFALKESPTFLDSLDTVLQAAIYQNIHSIQPALSTTLLAEGVTPSAYANGEISYTPSFRLGSKRNKNGGFNAVATIENGLDVQAGFSGGSLLSAAFGLNTKGKATYSIEYGQGKLQELNLTLEIPEFAANQLESITGQEITNKIEKINSEISNKGQIISLVKAELKIENLQDVVDSGLSVVQNMIDLTQIDNLDEFTGDIMTTLADISDLFMSLRSNASVEIKAVAEQVVSIEVEGNIFVGGEFSASIGTTELFQL